MGKMCGKKIHFIGAGGVGMAGLAFLLKARGCEVTGCDVHASARTRWLEAQGIPVAIGHSPDHVKDVDEVVVTPAVRRDEPEVAACRAPLRFRGEVLAELANACETIAVCGSHGKTTTATWIARLLLALGEPVSWCIGGETGDFPVAGVPPEASRPERPLLVVEADESDGTLALHRAKTLVVNRCDYDHPDHFKTEADYFACYETAKRQADEVIESESLGTVEEAEERTWWRALPPHNRKNARAAIEVALRRGHRLGDVLDALEPIVGTLPDRRFQVLWPRGKDEGQQTADEGLGTFGSRRSTLASPREDSSTLQLLNSSTLVVTDYAHHPTEMACAVGMARQICRGRLRVLFQPHRYSRTKALLTAFPSSFEKADEVVLCPTYAAFEPPLEGGDIADLYAACRARFAGAPRLFLAQGCAEAWEHAFNSTADGDVTLLLGAGDIINLAPQDERDMAARAAGRLAAKPRRIWIGGGFNTWKSDLNLNVGYAKTEGPAGRPGASLGIPWMAGIPGTVGGWVKMNAGAFGHSIAEVLEAVKVDGAWRSVAECGFAYRHSDIVGEIQDVRLKSPLPVESAETAEDYLARRRKFPAETFGSFFKNPPGDFAGRLLEAVGAKGLRVGGAYVWAEHANVIVRGEGATPSDVLALARLMRQRVLFRFGIGLEPEVSGLGRDFAG